MPNHPATSAEELALAVPPSPNYAITPTGLTVNGPLSRDEWRDIGLRIGRAMRSAAFVIGDWLVYGEGRDAQATLFADTPAENRVSGKLYAEASALTGIDISSLQTYAHVARHVPPSIRSSVVSFEAHRKVAKLPDVQEKRRWIELVEARASSDDPISCRRLARSIAVGRVVEPEEMRAEDQDRGIDSAIPHVGRILAFFRGLGGDGWLRSAPPAKVAALARDLKPVVDLHARLTAVAED